MVFITLARKAGALARHPALPAWLYRSLSFAAADLRRSEARRKLRERMTAAQSALISDTDGAVDWCRIRPVLDEAMNEIGESDREAIVLRYLASRTFADIGGRLGVGENTARMRVERALDRLRTRLAKRGITSTGIALAAGLSTEAGLGAPIGVATAVTAAGLAAGASGSAGLLLLMGTHKILAGAFGVLIVTGVAAVAIQERGNSRLEARIADLQTRAQEIGGLRQENLSLSKSLDEVRRLQNASRDGGVIAAKLKALRAENAALKRNISATVAHQPGDMAGNASSGGSNPPALNKLPRPVMQPRPEYPSDMRAQRTAGQVVVDFIVDATGNVQNAYSLSSTQREFEQSAVAAVSLWKFNPGQVGAHKINTHMQVPVVFSIGNQGADTASAPTPATSPAPDSPNGWFSGGQEVVTLVPFTVQAD